MSAKTKLEEYKQLINKLDTIEEERPRKDSWDQKGNQNEAWKKDDLKGQKFFTKTFPLAPVEPEIGSYRTHNKEPSALTFRSEYHSS